MLYADTRVIPGDIWYMEKYSITAEEKRILMLMLRSPSIDYVAYRVGIRRQTLIRRIRALKKKLRAGSTVEMIVRSLCLDNELKEYAETRAEIASYKIEKGIILNNLERTVFIETLNGKNVKQIAEDFGCEQDRIINLKVTLKRKLLIHNDCDFVIKAIAIGLLAFELNYLPVQAIRNNKDALWNYFQDYIKNQKNSGLLYSPIFSFKAKKLLEVSPDSIQIIELRILGKSNGEIAEITGYTRQTISRKIRKVKKCHNLNGAADIVLWAIKHELIELESPDESKSFSPKANKIFELLHAGVQRSEIAAKLEVSESSISTNLGYLKKKWEINTIEGLFFIWFCSKFAKTE